MKLSLQPKKQLVLNELLTISQQPHPNICNYIDSYLHDGDLYLVLEYVNGGSLTEIIEYNTLSEPQIGKIVKEVLGGINHLHGRGIIHRDIKSDNVLVDFRGKSVKLTDFGMCCRLTDRKLKRETTIGTVSLFFNF